MKLLFLTQEERLLAVDDVIQQLRPIVGTLDVRSLSESQVNNLKQYTSQQTDLNRYDHIVVSLSFDIANKQIKYLKTLKNLTFLHITSIDPSGNDEIYAKRWLNFYRKLPWVRVLVRNGILANYLQQQGLDAWNIGIGIDENSFENYYCERKIQLACICSNHTYISPETEQLLSILKIKYSNLLIEKQLHLKGHVTRLNQCQIVVLPLLEKIGYDIATFQAMACGAVLVTYNLGDEENKFYGFSDMDNVVLFKNLKELEQKLELLINDPALVSKIASKGTLHASKFLSAKAVAKRVATLLSDPLRNPDDYQIGLSIFGVKF